MGTFGAVFGPDSVHQLVDLSMSSKRHPSALRTDHQFLSDRFRCITAHSPLGHAALCRKESYPIQASQTVFGMGLAPLL